VCVVGRCRTLSARVTKPTKPNGVCASVMCAKARTAPSTEISIVAPKLMFYPAHLLQGLSYFADVQGRAGRSEPRPIDTSRSMSGKKIETSSLQPMHPEEARGESLTPRMSEGFAGSSESTGPLTAAASAADRNLSSERTSRLARCSLRSLPAERISLTPGWEEGGGGSGWRGQRLQTMDDGSCAASGRQWSMVRTRRQKEFGTKT